MEWTIPAFAFPAEAGTHLPTQEGWKAELALGGWLVTTSYSRLKINGRLQNKLQNDVSSPDDAVAM